jgi:hypothetical protein
VPRAGAGGENNFNRTVLPSTPLPNGTQDVPFICLNSHFHAGKILAGWDDKIRENEKKAERLDEEMTIDYLIVTSLKKQIEGMEETSPKTSPGRIWNRWMRQSSRLGLMLSQLRGRGSLVSGWLKQALRGSIVLSVQCRPASLPPSRRFLIGESHPQGAEWTLAGE